MTPKTMIVILLQTVMIRTVLLTLVANTNNALILIFLSPVMVIAFLRALTAATEEGGVVREPSVWGMVAAPSKVFVMILFACRQEASVVTSGQVATAQQHYRNAAPGGAAPQVHTAAMKVTSAVREGGVARQMSNAVAGDAVYQGATVPVGYVSLINLQD
jgi:hypothetical protein